MVSVHLLCRYFFEKMSKFKVLKAATWIHDILMLLNCYNSETIINKI